MIEAKDKRIVILIGDGMADYPVDELEGKTPLETANTPNMDRIAAEGILGLTRTVPEGMHPGSDVANLSAFGYDPELYYTGRAPLEALNMDVELGPDDVAFRCNLVTIENNIMEDFSADHIDTAFTEIVIKELQKSLSSVDIELYPGVSYRNLLVWRNYPFTSIAKTTPPHDIQSQNIKEYLPAGEGADELIRLMKESQFIISKSDIIKNKTSEFKGKPQSIWLWGAGKRPAVDTLQERFGLYGYTISAVDLIHGIGKAAGLTPLPVEGATGYIDTNYYGKAEALLKGIKDANFVFLHVEAPDESGHEGRIDYKIKSIEDFDSKVVGPVLEGLREYEDYSVLVMPDHPTPVKLRTHTSDPVPFCIYSNKYISGFRKSSPQSCFTERSASDTGNLVSKASDLVGILQNNGIK
ncbi:MAG: cofactor-independent phosphoglycerate mutase [Spirochaetes bacterium]|nr:cofactor-independent phosphoglycerate mutase [Spirochaetota bacterium]